MTQKFKVLSLFAGIGGFDLGLERTGGFETVAFCEIDPFCRKVLAKHWPNVRQYEDVRELTAKQLRADEIAVDVICGGFPCQDISEAGKGAGIEGERSGLWAEYARLIGEIRPGHVIVENVAALLARGFGRVLGDLAALGYDAEWHCIPAHAVGAPHRRDRIWIMAYPDCGGRGQSARALDTPRQSLCQAIREEGASWLGPSSEALALANSARYQGAGCELSGGRPIFAGSLVQADRQWTPEPAVGRVVDGIPNWSHRIRSLGNAVVPQIPELIGRAILEARNA